MNRGGEDVGETAHGGWLVGAGLDNVDTTLGEGVISNPTDSRRLLAPVCLVVGCGRRAGGRAGWVGYM